MSRLPRPVTKAIPTITQPMIMRRLEVHVDHSVQLSSDLHANALISTFMVQNYSSNPFTVYLTLQHVERPIHEPVAWIEIPAGACPIFQIPSQSATDSALVWDLTHYWLIGDEGSGKETEHVCLCAFPLPM